MTTPALQFTKPALQLINRRPTALLKTLVLGHGKYYKQFPDGARCACLPYKEWCDEHYTSVDSDPTVEPDIVYDLRQCPWRFSKNEEWDRIIDATGIELQGSDGYPNKIIVEIKRILRPSGRFYGSLRGKPYGSVIYFNYFKYNNQLEITKK